MSLDKLRADIEKKYGADLMQTASKSGVVEMPRFSTGSIVLDVDSGGGIPENKIMEIFGPESSGKSFLLYNAIRTVTNREKNFKAILFDEEGSFDNAWGEKIGIKLENLEIVRSQYAEQALDIMELAVQSGDFGLAALDSIAALIPKEELEASTEDWQMGLTARLMNKACRKMYRALNSSTSQGGSTAVILINQLRLKIGRVFGNPETTPGGNGPKYASSIRLDVRKSEMLKHNEEVYGQTSTYVFVKNKTAPPLKKFEFSFFTDGALKGQFDNVRAVVEFGLEMGTLVKSGTWISGKWMGTVKKGKKDESFKLQGVDQVVDWMYEQDREKLNSFLTDVEASYLNGKPLAFRF